MNSSLRECATKGTVRGRDDSNDGAAGRSQSPQAGNRRDARQGGRPGKPSVLPMVAAQDLCRLANTWGCGVEGTAQSLRPGLRRVQSKEKAFGRGYGFGGEMDWRR